MAPPKATGRLTTTRRSSGSGNEGRGAAVTQQMDVHMLEDDETKLFTPDKKKIITTSTPKTAVVELKRVQDPKKPKATGSKTGNNKAANRTGSKRNRSGNTGTTPEGKKPHGYESGISDESALAVGEFTASVEDSLNSIEEEIVANKTGLKRANQPIKNKFQAPPKIPRMGKRTGIEIRFFKRLERTDGSLSREEWDDAKGRIQEYLFDRELFDIFDKIKNTPHNGTEEAFSFGALTFATVEDMETVHQLMTEVRFKIRLSMQPVKPTKWQASFRIQGMLNIDPKKIINAIIRMNGLSGAAVIAEAKLTSDGSGRYITVSPDDKLLEDLRKREEEGQRLKTGFGQTTIRTFNIENKKDKE